jgi:lysophospholipid acyltransferase (LPLAT)-like uncharacterized protein
MKLKGINRVSRQKFFVSLGTLILRAWFATCRITIIGEDIQARILTRNESLVGATWHRGAIFLVWFFRKLKPMIMFSRSRDGEIIASYAEKLGVTPVRGSSHRGGRAALRHMVAHLEKPGSMAATVLDGPKGPRYVAKKGMIVLAMKARAPLVPIIVSAHPAITLKKTWDKTMIPLPFSRVTVMYDEPILPPPKLDRQQLDELTQAVASKLNDMMAQADRHTGYKTIAPDTPPISPAQT